MSWSKVKSGNKPLMWWYHKILCEFWWHVGNLKQYYKSLDRLCSYGFNLYGQKFKGK